MNFETAREIRQAASDRFYGLHVILATLLGVVGSVWLAYFIITTFVPHDLRALAALILVAALVMLDMMFETRDFVSEWFRDFQVRNLVGSDLWITPLEDESFFYEVVPSDAPRAASESLVFILPISGLGNQHRADTGIAVNTIALPERDKDKLRRLRGWRVRYSHSVNSIIYVTLSHLTGRLTLPVHQAYEICRSVIPTIYSADPTYSEVIREYMTRSDSANQKLQDLQKSYDMLESIIAWNKKELFEELLKLTGGTTPRAPKQVIRIRLELLQRYLKFLDPGDVSYECAEQEIADLKEYLGDPIESPPSS